MVLLFRGARGRQGRKEGFLSVPDLYRYLLLWYCMLLRSTLCSPALKSAATSSRLFSGEKHKIELYYMLLYCILLYKVKKNRFPLLLASPRAGRLSPQPANRVAVVAPL